MDTISHGRKLEMAKFTRRLVTSLAHLQLLTSGATARNGMGSEAIPIVNGQFQSTPGALLDERGSQFVLDAEVVGVLCRVHLIFETQLVDNVTVFTDSQRALFCIEGRDNGATEMLPKVIKKALRGERCNTEECEVRLQWYARH